MCSISHWPDNKHRWRYENITCNIIVKINWLYFLPFRGITFDFSVPFHVSLRWVDQVRTLLPKRLNQTMEVDYSVASLGRKKRKRKTRKRTKSQKVIASVYTLQLYDFLKNTNFPNTNNEQCEQSQMLINLNLCVCAHAHFCMCFSEKVQMLS